MSPTRADAFRYFGNQYVLGGDEDLRLSSLHDTHLKQIDTSLNKSLWDVFPVNELGQQGPQVPTRVDYNELALGSPVPWNSALGRKRSSEVLPLKDIMDQVIKKKEVVDNGAYRATVQGYAACLLDLMPWYATPLFFTAKQAFDSGLAQLNLYETVLKAPLPSMIKSELRLLAFEAVNDMRYVPANILYKTRCHHGADEATGVLIDLTGVYRECNTAMIEKNSSNWAHRNCVSWHQCFSSDIRAKAAVWVFEADWGLRPAPGGPLNMGQALALSPRYRALAKRG
ncbi:hypothetical protein A1Q2_02732 [Trichosporon asahii var. asahii CBS 8904]|uniref:Uncharacterized protein n=2 Tax=Trichosporon asahii var. asahii TaxID=189963 RepID=K1VQN8_TRIAC|nr:hypothetical protein A1Q1_07226 [Trichosporon asahii var. asahii CBS 2479]EJT51559.1 hypothetical protein A1Q1_07226 [Trichosporon asahii var. asahii CBS 2479]EKD02951.1 hypothetical protein A1Q2_02732 [Trichosporon asahii var. asahii CBS 8904]